MYFLSGHFELFSCSEKPKSGAGKMVHWIHVFAVKPDDVSSISRTHIIGENQLSLHMHSAMYPGRKMCKRKEPKPKAKIHKQTNKQTNIKLCPPLI